VSWLLPKYKAAQPVSSNNLPDAVYNTFQTVTNTSTPHHASVGMAGHTGGTVGTVGTCDTYDTSSGALLRNITDRLRQPISKIADYVHCYKHANNDSKVFVFVVQGEQATIIEDDWDLFPSDKLITQLRLLQK
jgi:hypothetical protein